MSSKLWQEIKSNPFYMEDQGQRRPSLLVSISVLAFIAIVPAVIFAGIFFGPALGTGEASMLVVLGALLTLAIIGGFIQVIAERQMRPAPVITVEPPKIGSKPSATMPPEIGGQLIQFPRDYRRRVLDAMSESTG